MRSSTSAPAAHETSGEIRRIAVQRIRPEDGLSRKRDRAGHEELLRSIEQFGVLTPITVRPAEDGTGEYLLVKGQGRTLACRMLGLATVPAHVLSGNRTEAEKAQQFLVENVARLKMRPVDRALLMQRAREAGEETASIARRFAVTPATVRRLLAQLNDAGASEVAALRTGQLSLSTHAVVARHVPSIERSSALRAISKWRPKPRELDHALNALSWQHLVAVHPRMTRERASLFEWVCKVLAGTRTQSDAERLLLLACELPLETNVETPERKTPA